MKKTFFPACFAVCAIFVLGSVSGADGPQISKDTAKTLLRPDLVVAGIDFQRVKSGTDSQGKTYWIFNVTAKIKNQGNGNAGAFKVLVERNNGAGGAWQTACQTCTIDVGGLAAGAEMTTDPRQFNNANGAPSRFKFTADSAGQVGESNERNNTREEAFVSMVLEKEPVVIGGGGPVPILKCDLTVLSLDFQNLSSTTSGGVTTWSFDVVAVVKNLGPGPSPACDIVFQRAFVDDPHGNVFFAFKPVPALGNNATATISAHTSWESTQKKRIYDAAVDCYGNVDETIENNNQKYITQNFGVPERPVSRPVF